MEQLPFSLNFFKQIEIFQDLKRLDEQFEKMRVEWSNGEFRKRGMSNGIQVNYPTWEIEKKILFWSVKHHKHLGSSITTSRLDKDDEFIEDIHVSRTELAMAGIEETLKNLDSRGLAKYNNGGIIISKKGFGYGLLISDIYKIIKEGKIEKGKIKYREETLKKKNNKWLGYNLIYLTGLTLFISTLLFLSLNIFRNTNLGVPLTMEIKNFIKICFTIIGFFPLIFLILGLFLIKIFK